MEKERRPVSVHDGLTGNLLATMRISYEIGVDTKALQKTIRDGIQATVNPINTNPAISNINS